MQCRDMALSQNRLSRILYTLNVFICEARNIAPIDKLGNQEIQDSAILGSKQHFRILWLKNYNKQPREFVLTHMGMVYGSFRK